MKNRGKLNSIVSRASKGVGQTGLNQVYELRAKRKGIEKMSDLCRILYQYYNMLPSDKKLRAFMAKKAKTLSSFIPMSINVINKT